jgi:hypothetical protein
VISLPLTTHSDFWSAAQMEHDELDDATRATLDAGRDPSEFEFAPADPSLSGAPDFPAVRRITVRNRKTGKVREYHEGGGSDWSIVFGMDLIAGTFD